MNICPSKESVVVVGLVDDKVEVCRGGLQNE